MRNLNRFPIIIISFSTIAGAFFHKPVLAVEAAINRYETIIEVKNEISNGISNNSIKVNDIIAPVHDMT